MISLLNIDPLQENWDASLQALIVSLRQTLCAFKMAITVQGNIGTPSQVTIQIQDSTGRDLAQKFFIRVRVVNNGAYTNATNAVIAVLTGTLCDVFTAGKDFVVQSNSVGLVKLQLTDATAETVQILLGAPNLAASFADYNNSQTVVHA